MFRLFICLFCMLSAFSFQLSAQNIDAETKKKINRYLERYLSDKSPGVAAGIVKDGEIVYEQYFGYADLQHEIRLNEGSRVNIASVAKQFTALCILKLAEENKINLEEDFRTYLPGYYKDITEKMPIKQLLNHSSGIRDFYDLMSIQSNPWWQNVGLDNGDALDLIKNQETLNFPPGSEHLYSNSNYTLLTAIVEKASGLAFDQYAKQLFEELGMSQTQFSTNYMAVIPQLARPYSEWGDGIWKEYPMLANLHGDGFLYTTLSDQLNYEKQLQSAALPNWLQASQGPIPNANITSYGCGVEFKDFLGYSAIWHSGGTGSYNAYFIRIPEEQLSIFMMSNNGNIPSGYIAEQIAKLLLPEKAAIAESKQKEEKATTVPTLAFKASPRYLRQLEGSYLNDEVDVEFTLTANSDSTFRIKIDGELDEIKLTAEDQLQFYNFQLKVKRDEINDPVALVLSYNRVKNLYFHKKEILVEPFQNTSDEGIISVVTTAKSYGKGMGDILLTKNDPKGNEEWFTTYGGTSYDRASSVYITPDNGYIIVGSTSSFGNGNYDVWVIKTDAKGKEQWNKTYGSLTNEYGYALELTDDGGYLVKAKTLTVNEAEEPVDYKWLIKLDENGQKISERTLSW